MAQDTQVLIIGDYYDVPRQRLIDQYPCAIYEDAADPAALADMVAGYKEAMTDPIELSVLDCHINDEAYSMKVLEVLDGWIADGTIQMPE